MKRTINFKLLVLAIAAVTFGILTGFNINSIAADGNNSVAITAQTNTSPDLSPNAKCGDGKSDTKKSAEKVAKCGDGKCGDGKADTTKTTQKVAKCGDGKCGDGKADSTKTAQKNSKCGDGKSTDKKAEKKDAKCGDGKCG
jgi:uncharacterized low-complexity protein